MPDSTLKNRFLIVVLTIAPALGQQYRALRTADNEPDLQGAWQAQTTASYDIQDHSEGPGIPAGIGIVVGGQIPYKPEAAAKRAENFRNRATADPNSNCF